MKRYPDLAGLILLGLVFTMAAGAARISAAKGPDALATPHGIQGAGTSGFVVVNLDSTETMDFDSRFFKPGGGPPYNLHMSSIAPRNGGTIYLPSQAGLASGYYSVLTTATRPFAITARTDWNASGAAAMYSPPITGTRIAVPLSVRGYHAMSSIVIIQNMDADESVEVALSAVPYGLSTHVLTQQYVITRGASVALDLDKDVSFVELGLGFIGTLWVEAPKPVAVISFVNIDDPASKAVMGFDGQPERAAAPVVYIPQVVADGQPRGDQLAGIERTMIAIANPEPLPVSVELAYLGTAGTCMGQRIVHGGRSFQLEPGSGALFAQGADGSALATGSSGLPAGCVATATVTATGGKVMATAAELRSVDGLALNAAAYDAVPAGSQRSFVPLFRRRQAFAGDELSTEVVAMNLGSEPAHATLSVTSGISGLPAPCSAPCSAIVAPGSSVTWAGDALEGVQSNMYGVASVESDQPLAVVYFDTWRHAKGDLSADNAISLDPDKVAAGPGQILGLPAVFNRASAEPPTPASGTVAVPSATAIAGTPVVPSPTAVPPVPTTRAPGPKEIAYSSMLIGNLNPLETLHGNIDVIGQPDGVRSALSVSPIAGGSASSVFMPTVPDLPNGRFAGVVHTDQPSAVLTALMFPLSSGLAVDEPATAATDIVLPFAQLGFQGHNALVTIQNVDLAASSTFDATLYDDAGMPAATLTRSLMPGDSTTLDLGREPQLAGVPTGFIGSLRFRSATNIAVSSLVDIESSPQAVYSFNGEPAVLAASDAYVPVFHARSAPSTIDAAPDAEQSTRIAVVNPGVDAVDVTLAYAGNQGSCVGRSSVHGGHSYAIPPNGQAVFDQGPGGAGLATGASGLPAGCGGVARITAHGGSILAAAVNMASSLGVVQAADAISAFRAPDAARQVYLPLFRKAFVGFTTSATALNLGSESASVELQTKTGWVGQDTGCGAGCLASIGPGEAITFDAAGLADLAANSNGSATITSDQPIVVAVEDVLRGYRGDMAGYRGFRLDVPLNGIAATQHALPLLARNHYIRRPGPPVNYSGSGVAKLQGRLLFRSLVPLALTGPLR